MASLVQNDLNIFNGERRESIYIGGLFRTAQQNEKL